MEEKKEPQAPIVEQLKDYAETQVKLAKFKAIEGGSTIAAGLISDMVVAFSFVLAFVFGSITLGYYLGSVLHSEWMGFGCVTVLYLLIAFFFIVNKKNFEGPIANSFVRKFFKN
jgi:hypothetical protein